MTYIHIYINRRRRPSSPPPLSSPRWRISYSRDRLTSLCRWVCVYICSVPSHSWHRTNIHTYTKTFILTSYTHTHTQGAYTDPDLATSSKDAKVDPNASSSTVLLEKSNNYFDVVFPRAYMKELKEVRIRDECVCVSICVSVCLYEGAQRSKLILYDCVCLYIYLLSFLPYVHIKHKQ